MVLDLHEGGGSPQVFPPQGPLALGAVPLGLSPPGYQDQVSAVLQKLDRRGQGVGGPVQV